MKLRLQSNSIRLRLKRSEVQRLVETGVIEEKIVFGGGSDNAFHYVLESSPTVPGLRATLTKRGILVQAPADAVARWAGGEDVGIEATVPAGDGIDLRLIIEKDFACLNGTEEQNRDTFPNPQEGTKC